MRLVPFQKIIGRSNVRQLKPRSLAELHTAYYPMIFRYIAFRIGDTAVAEQLADQLFLLLLEESPRFGEKADCVQQLLLSLAAKAVMGYQKGDTHPVKSAVSRSTVLASVSELSEEHQILLALIYGSLLTIDQAAQALNHSVETTRRLQAQAIIALHKQMQGCKPPG